VGQTQSYLAVHALLTEPPHIVPLALLAELGMMGALGFIVFLGGFLIFLRPSRSLRPWMAWLPIFSLLPVLFTDHFLWTWWPGHVLLILAFAWGFLWKQET
jgi:hypothetical protein